MVDLIVSMCAEVYAPCQCIVGYYHDGIVEQSVV